MKAMFYRFSVGLVLLVLGWTQANAQIKASALASTPAVIATAANTYTLDLAHSCVSWQVSHFGFSYPSGKWMVGGTIIYNEAQPELSRVDVSIPMAAIETAIPALNEHLKGVLFFDVKQFPNAYFVSQKITIINPTTAKVQGILTLKGIAQPITLQVRLNKIGINPITQKETLGMSAVGKLKRSDYDITTLLPGISDEVDLTIEVEAYR